MNRDIAEGKWKQFKAQIKEKWADITDDDLNKAEGSSERFIGILQERYGLAKEDAKKQFEELKKKIS
ncbi:CsbD family protein [Spongiibacter taiwanensis]|uniref:CsbD family protein n=1 Tax=Spongiibacter taiwanensis TaxID=1748242 RepID=UPI002034B12E|nr:CsbD family protein [Spongiibacter taiwanensis]USA44444.1 CsbD family protein [Spongiibacter taiwanensis]